MSLARKLDSALDKLWVSWDHTKVDNDETCVPFSCDYAIDSFVKLIDESIPIYGPRCIILTGDAAHDETDQKLKKSGSLRHANASGKENCQQLPLGVRGI